MSEVLPDLGQSEAGVAIVVRNLRAQSILFSASLLEESGLFQVVDRVVGLFVAGRLPVSTGTAGNRLYQYWRSERTRLSEREQRELYARAIGTRTVDIADDVTPNREFHELWIRSLTSVDAFARQVELKNTASVSQASVWHSARELAVNLSRHGGGVVPFAAKDLAQQIREAMHVLAIPDIRNAFGARDPWQVVERVSELYLGKCVDATSYQKRAENGGTIIDWLASRRTALVRAKAVPLFRISHHPKKPPRVVISRPDRRVIAATRQLLSIEKDED